jgi:hypothetical protein
VYICVTRFTSTRPPERQRPYPKSNPALPRRPPRSWRTQGGRIEKSGTHRGGPIHKDLQKSG